VAPQTARMARSRVACIKFIVSFAPVCSLAA
jgi:hypothetical protein